MSTAKQADDNITKHRAAETDAAHRQQKDDPAEKQTSGDDRLSKDQTGHGDTHGKGVDETGKNSRAPHSGQ
ncbi:hypothetical protein AEAC466_08175 [Asticcacaulis sp. AC466]|uniref:hypothetical protein n=1 Tax=Asticcacaulis sp. AC466 TaxID=1282362 RepID=UPI0003C3F313|nr:hypothetical protein [Asticcacaulis sp. AC466]ESQ84322.1 hypothetical protein AEAC466_08175 [Asticcacaulis sp. AC466]